MGWATPIYKRVYKADVNKDNLAVIFARLYEDGRDEMSDCLRPSWEPVDDFIITITGLRTWKETKTYENMTRTTTHCKKTGEFEIRTKDKRIANWIWYLAEKQGLTFEQLKAMNEAKKFQ
jgi:hypothetical protein